MTKEETKKTRKNGRSHRIGGLAVGDTPCVIGPAI